VSHHALLLLPAGSAILYVVAVLLIKRTIACGTGQKTINLYVNLAPAIVFQALWCWAGAADWSLAWQPAATGAVYVLGQIFTFLALRHGDVSLATPLLGLKVLFTAVLSAALFAQVLPIRWWIGAAASSLGVILVTGATLRSLAPRLLRIDALSSITAAALFALTDLLVQEWALGFGVTAFIALMFGTAGILSLLIFVPREGPRVFRVAPRARGPLLGGSIVLGIQVLGMAIAIGLYGNATAVNIVYSSRSVWSVVLAVALGGWFGASERGAPPGTMRRRLAGSLLLFAAVAVVLL